MELATLKDLFVEELQDLYSAETQITEALPKMAEAANAAELKRAFEQHLKQTEGQIERLEKIFEKLGEEPGGKECKGMAGLIEEGEELISEKPDPEVLDAGLIAAAQRVEHYEIAGYGTARTYAEELGEKEFARLLQTTLDEEGETDKKLTKLAEGCINQKAKAA
jgi:ferritin-like metal-binding protein YciE